MIRTLVVEDNPGDADLAAERLALSRHATFRIDRVATRREAEAWLRDAACDVILLDLDLPDSHGLETVHAMRAVAASTPLVVVSGTAERLRDQAVAAGADEVIAKDELDSPLFQLGVLSVVDRARARTRLDADVQVVVADRLVSLGTLAAGVAHEINNPLEAVVTNVSLALEELRRRLPGDATLAGLEESLGEASAAALRIRRVVRDLRIFSRASDEPRTPCDLRAVLESVVRVARSELERSARLVWDLAPVPHVYADEARLGQVFLNLLTNAAQALEGSSEHKEIRISTRTDADRVIVEVHDTGPGIPTDVQRRMFTPFFTTRAVGTGTGLGLVVSRRIVASMGGEISFESAPGHGTRFVVTLLSAAAEDAVHGESLSPAPVTSRRGRVLVVDDDLVVLRAIRRTLVTAHDVTCFADPVQALARIERGERFDVILCDLMMPVMGGAELCGAIAAVDAEQASRIVVMTGGAFTPQAREFFASSPYPKLEKPFGPKTLREVVRRLVG